MKKLMALVLVVLTLAAFAGTASAKVRGEFVDMYQSPGNGHSYGHYK